MEIWNNERQFIMDGSDLSAREVVISMLTIQDLRKRITAQQRDILSTIWNSFQENDRWIPVRLLHYACSGKRVVRPALERLGGSIVFEIEETENTVYQLTLLGVLLTEQGDYCQTLIADYLRYTASMCNTEPQRKRMSSREVSAALKLAPKESILLGKLIRLYSYPFSGGGSFGVQQWDAVLPGNIEDLPTDLEQYVAECALENYDPNTPLPALEVHAYRAKKTLHGPNPHVVVKERLLLTGRTLLREIPYIGKAIDAGLFGKE
jgi:hypothetical protein